MAVGGGQRQVALVRRPHVRREQQPERVLEAVEGVEDDEQARDQPGHHRPGDEAAHVPLGRRAGACWHCGSGSRLPCSPSLRARGLGHPDDPLLIRPDLAGFPLQLLVQAHDQDGRIRTADFAQICARNPDFLTGLDVRDQHLGPGFLLQPPLIVLDVSNGRIEREPPVRETINRRPRRRGGHSLLGV